MSRTVGTAAAESPKPSTPHNDLKFYMGTANSQVLNYLTTHGYTQWTGYQAGSRFWPFQWIEGGWLLALPVLLIAATVWLVRRGTA